MKSRNESESGDAEGAIEQVPLELMDWVVDLKRQRQVGNPEHGGEPMIEV
jgi:hypothetical protein